MNGNVLEGYWIENGSSERCATAKNGRHHWGRIRWTFEGNRFTGSWSYCEKPVAGGGGWNGERIADAPIGLLPPAETTGAAVSGGKIAGVVDTARGIPASRASLLEWPRAHATHRLHHDENVVLDRSTP